MPYIAEGGSRASLVSLSSSLMEVRGRAWHMHCSSGALMANHDHALMQDDAVEHGRAPGQGWRSRQGGIR